MFPPPALCLYNQGNTEVQDSIWVPLLTWSFGFQLLPSTWKESWSTIWRKKSCGRIPANSHQYNGFGSCWYLPQQLTSVPRSHSWQLCYFARIAIDLYFFYLSFRSPFVFSCIPSFPPWNVSIWFLAFRFDPFSLELFSCWSFCISNLTNTLSS